MRTGSGPPWKYARLGVFLSLLTAVAGAAAPPLLPGVPLELARWRASQYRDLQYRLSLELKPGASLASGMAEIRVSLPAAVPDFVLDWRPGPGAALADFVVNGMPDAPHLENGHLVVPARLLHAGENVVALAFSTPISESGSALTRYRDREDGAEYVYSLLVPADASTVFPCVDQPDLKARISLDIAAPAGWTVIANSPLARMQTREAQSVHGFGVTPPISTYLFAFAAGPFVATADAASPVGTRLYARASRAGRARAAADEVLRLNREALAYFQRYFAAPFPFPKYDLVLIPEFAYGGMEHAGATFLREDAILFPSDPSANDIMRRAQLLFHEASHQWFGDSVTMRWFDDLWLKEGFANLMAAKAAEVLMPAYPAWNGFHALKVSSYRTDSTPGTTAIYQPLANLADAKSAYGNIVYGKAPAILRQAEFYLGEEAFRRGVRDFLARHSYGTAQWSELVRALERASGRKLAVWARNWVTRRGLPRVRALWELNARGRLGSLRLEQSDPLDAGGPWPMRLRILVSSGASSRIADVRLSGRSAVVRGFAGSPPPELVFANAGDFGYGQFLLDARSRATVLRDAGKIQDPFLRALLIDSLWESVREAEIAPLEYAALVLQVAPAESDETTLAALLARLDYAMNHYLSEAQVRALAQPVEEMLAASMLAAPTPGRRITFLRAFMDSGRTESARTALKSLLAGATAIPGVRLRSRDRFRMVRTLLARGDTESEALLAALSAEDPSDEGRRYAWAAAAARPDPEAKRRYFEQFGSTSVIAESWVEEALGPFNDPAQAALTAAYLPRALAQLPELKRTRKIFFVNNWLAAFIGGQSGASALAEVRRFLDAGSLESDLRLKVLEATDALERSVRIRARYASSPDS